MKIVHKAVIAAVVNCILAGPVVANTNVVDGTIVKTEVISSTTGKEGRPLLGAAAGVGIGSTIGSGSGKDAAMIVGGLAGAKHQKNKRKKTNTGWRYLIETEESVQVVDSWCQSNKSCEGLKEGTAVYVINGKEVVAK